MEAASGQLHDASKALVWSACMLMFFLATGKLLGKAPNLKRRVDAGCAMIPETVELSPHLRDLLQVRMHISLIVLISIIFLLIAHLYPD